MNLKPPMEKASVRIIIGATTLLFTLFPGLLRAQTTYTWNGSVSNAWNVPANWTPGSGFPLAGDHAVIVAAANNPVLDSPRSVTDLRVNSGVLDLNGFTLTSTGNGAFNAGSVNNGTLAPSSAAGTMNFAGTTFNASVTGTTSVLQFAGSTFNAPLNITKTGTSNDYSSGNNVFNNTATFSVTAGRLYLANTGTTAFNGNVVVNSTAASGGVWMGQTTGTLTLAAGRTFSAGTFTIGSLLFRNFTQLGTTAQNIALTGTATLYFQAGSSFGGNVVSSSSGLYFTGTTFNGTAKFTKTGGANEYSGGGNTFQSSTEFTVAGAGTLYPANTGADQYNGDLLVACTGTGGIIFGNGGGTSTLAPGRLLQVGTGGYAAGPLYLRNFNISGSAAQSLSLGTLATYLQSAGTVFGGDLTVTAGAVMLNGGTVNGNATYTKTGTTNDWGTGGCTFNGVLDLTNTGAGILGPCNTGAETYNGDIRVSNTSTGSIRFGNGGGIGTLAAGRTLTVGSGGYDDGLFLLDHFIQTGATPQTITLGASALMYIRSGCDFGGDLSITAEGYYINGSTFHGACMFTKTGSANEGSQGGNIFHGPVDFVVSGDGGFFMADGGADLYNDDIRVTTTGTGQIRFGNGGGTSTLAAGRTITVGAGGYTGSILLLRGFTQIGPTPQVIDLPTTASLYIYPNCVFDGDLTTTSGSIHLYNSTFNGDVFVRKTAAASNTSQGGNVFQGDLEIVNESTGVVYMGESIVDAYNGDIRVNNLSTGQIRFGNSVGGGGVLASGKTITVGAEGFDSGILLLRYFTQSGSTPQNIHLTGSAQLYLYIGSEFNGAMDAEASSIVVNTATFNAPVKLTRWGTTSDNCSANSFASTLEMVNNGTGGFYMGDATGDVYAGDITISNTSTGTIRWGNGGGLNTLPSGLSISVGNGGFDAGTLLFRGFTQLGTTPFALVLGSNAQFNIRPGCTFDAPMDVSAGEIYLEGSTFNNTVFLTKTGTGTNGSGGGNTFNGTLELVNTTSGHFMMAETFVDFYNDDVLVNNLSTGTIRFNNSGASGAVLAAGHTVMVGSQGFPSGALRFRNFDQLGNAPVNLPLGPTASLFFLPGCEFGGDVVATCGSLLLNGSTFNGTGNFTKNDNSGNMSDGGCVFQGSVEFTNNGSGYIGLDNVLPDQFNGDIILNNTTSGAIYFGYTTGSATLAAGRVITVGAGGYDAGLLQLRNFTQVGGTPQTLTLGNAANLTFQSGTTFNGDIVTTSGRLHFVGATFNGTATFTKTNGQGDSSYGGNTFNGRTEFSVTGTGHLSLTQYVGTDLFNEDLVLNSTLTGQISFGISGGTAILADGKTVSIGSLGFDAGYLLFRNFTQVGPTPQSLVLGTLARLDFGSGNTFNGDITSTSGRLFFQGTTFNGNGRFTKTGSSGDGSVGNNVFNGEAEFTITSTGHLALHQNAPDVFNGNVYVNNTSTGMISFGQGTGTGTLAAGRVITVGGLGFNAGSLVMRNFTQLGSTPQNLPLGNAANLTLQTANTFNGPITTTSGTLFLNGSTFNDAARFTKNGPSGDGCAGGNTFNGLTEFINTSTGHLSLDQNGIDAFNGDVLVNSTSSGQISFGQISGSATLAAGRTIAVGSLGFNTGTLAIRQFTQVGGTPQTLMLGTGANLYFMTGSTFNGNVTASAGNMFMNGTTFNGTGWFRKTGAGGNSCTGGNLFAGETELINTGAGTWFMANTGNDAYGSDLLLNSTAAGGINFGNSTGTSLVSGGMLGVGSTGFSAGTFVFRNFAKSSAMATLIPSSTVNTGVTFAANSVFNGAVTVTAGHLLFNGTTMNGNAVFTKTNAANNSSAGGNVFNGDVEINAGGQITLAVSAADDFNGNATFRRTGAGTFIVGNTFNTSFSRNVSTVGSTGGSVQFGAGAGRTIFDGTTIQTFSSDAAFPPQVRNMTLAMTGAGELQLLGNVNVNVDLAFSSGVVKPMAATSTSNGLLILANGITFSDAADATSHVDGFVRKIGNAAFAFPVGNAGVYAPILMSAPGNAAHHFTAKYVYTDPDPLYDDGLHDPSIHHISGCEYWILDRTNSTTNVTVTLSFDAVRSCGVDNLADLVVARWNGSMWKDHGQGTLTGTLASGTISTAAPVTAFSPFTLASRTSMNPLPIELITFNAEDAGTYVRTSWVTATETNNERFEVERSADAQTFELIGTVNGAGSSQSILQYEYMDERPLQGTAYYRLKQIDFDGAYTYSDLVAVTRVSSAAELLIWPNPVEDGLNIVSNDGMVPSSVRIHDAAGRLVLEHVNSGLHGVLELRLGDAPSGTLFLTLYMPDGTIRQERLVKR